MPKTKAVAPGDRVTLGSGRKVDTDYTPGTCDLGGTRVVVMDEPSERFSAVDGKVQDRVHVRPVMPSGKLGMPLDVPTARIEQHHKRRSAFASLGGTAERFARIFGGSGRREG